MTKEELIKLKDSDRYNVVIGTKTSNWEQIRVKVKKLEGGTYRPKRIWKVTFPKHDLVIYSTSNVKGVICNIPEHRLVFKWEAGPTPKPRGKKPSKGEFSAKHVHLVWRHYKKQGTKITHKEARQMLENKTIKLHEATQGLRRK
jgi:hypothetical protein